MQHVTRGSLYSFVRTRTPGKVIVSKSFPTKGNARYASEVVEGAEEGLQFATELGEVVL